MGRVRADVNGEVNFFWEGGRGWGWVGGQGRCERRSEGLKFSPNNILILFYKKIKVSSLYL